MQRLEDSNVAASFGRAGVDAQHAGVARIGNVDQAAPAVVGELARNLGHALQAARDIAMHLAIRMIFAADGVRLVEVDAIERTGVAIESPKNVG